MLARLCTSAPKFAIANCVVLVLACSSGGSDATEASGGSGATTSGGRPGSAGSATSGGASSAGGTTGKAGESASSGAPTGVSPALGGAAGTTLGVGGNAGGTESGTGGRAGASTSGNAGVAGSSGGTDATGTVPTSDTFDGKSLDSSWNVFRPDLADITVADGSLSIVPHSGALWYQTSQADLVYKLVTGNFKATTTVHARKASNRMQTPSQFADVGGIMARNPSGSSENYILGVVGYAEMNQLAVEHKSTTSGKSVYGEVAFTPDAEFRMCRVGSTFTIYYRHLGDTTWGPAFDPFERPDLPATVQVGAIAYTGVSSPDFVAIFDNFTFEPLGAGCTQ